MLQSPFSDYYILQIISKAHQITMNKLLPQISKLQKGFKEWTSKMGLRVDYLIDKYKIIKVGCVVGTGIS